MFQNLTFAELETLQATRPDLLLVDVRNADELTTLGYIPKAFFCPVARLQSVFGDGDFVSPTKPIAVICQAGVRSDYACYQLSLWGYSNVFNVVEGMQAYQGERCYKLSLHQQVGR